MEHTFQVHGMTCGHCEMAIKKAVLRLDTQAQVQIDRSHDTVVVQTEQARETVAHVIAEEGYVVA
ncbi:heavy-metal-associated domain-containing protein [Limnohabitans sp. B9-3]|uniref:heavy-metal-associated domain-containing protein n=1 Tax=Limnohabitans sp. B9-3 TaxID=1100707 RepID=UPI000C1E1066|nr:heavy-metal-associated domain-containing protein [Limnohabitans sp. B9-3]PIT72980.1 heavy metal transport/detoxification protein [Limnohabitans sp. B9-3]